MNSKEVLKMVAEAKQEIQQGGNPDSVCADLYNRIYEFAGYTRAQKAIHIFINEVI